MQSAAWRRRSAPASPLPHAHSRSPSRFSSPGRSPSPGCEVPAVLTCTVTATRPAGRCGLGSANKHPRLWESVRQRLTSCGSRPLPRQRARLRTCAGMCGPSCFSAGCSKFQTPGTKAMRSHPAVHRARVSREPHASRHPGPTSRQRPAILSLCYSPTPAPPSQPQKPTRKASLHCYSFLLIKALKLKAKSPGVATGALLRRSQHVAGPKGWAWGVTTAG